MNIRESDFFTNSANKVMYMAMSAFAKEVVLMNEKERTIARKRMEKELDIIMGNGFYYEYYLLKKIVDHSITVKRLLIVGGQISYSYVAYLLGISTIDPLKRDYKAEMLFDYHHDRNPYMVLYMPDDYLLILLAHLGKIFGERMIDFDDFSITLGSRNDSDDHLTIGYLDSPLLTLVDKIVTKMESVSPNSFRRTRESIFRSYYPTGSFAEETTDRITTNLKWNYVHEDNPYPVDSEGVKLFDGTYEGLLKALAAVHGKGIAGLNLYDAKNSKLLTRDDFYEFGLKLFGDEIPAYDFMTKIRKGRGNDERFQVLLEKKGVPNDVREKIKNIQYVVSEGSIIPEAQLILFLVRDCIWEY